MPNQRTQFTALMRILHWTMAAMVLTMLGIGVAMVASLGDYHVLVSIHRPLGVAILILVVVRFVVRRLSQLPPWVPTMSRLERLAASAGEYTMYGLMFALPLVGWSMLSAARYPIVLFWLRPLAVHPAARRPAVRDLAEGAHGPGILALPGIPRPLRGDLVPHADRPGWNAVPDGAMECSAARGRPRQRATDGTERIRSTTDSGGWSPRRNAMTANASAIEAADGSGSRHWPTKDSPLPPVSGAYSSPTQPGETSGCGCCACAGPAECAFRAPRHGGARPRRGMERLAHHVREAIAADRSGTRRPIIAIVDVQSQAYGRLEAALGADPPVTAAAADAYATARMAGHPVVALIVGNVLVGGLNAHGDQAHRLLAARMIPKSLSRLCTKQSAICRHAADGRRTLDETRQDRHSDGLRHPPVRQARLAARVDHRH